MIIGITVLPARLTRVAPAGTRMSAAGPTCAILAPSTTSVAFSITRPSPTINRAPSYAVTDWADAGNAKATSKPRATTTVTAATFTRCMETSSMNHALQLQSEIAASSEVIIEQQNLLQYPQPASPCQVHLDRKSTRLNSSHL